MPDPTEQTVIGPVGLLSLREAAELLVKHNGLHEGLYNLLFEFQIAVGAIGPSPELAIPGGMFGISGIGLEKVAAAGPHTVDAAIVNPAPRSPTTKPKSTRKRGVSTTS